MGDFSRAAGVMLILLISKISLGEFLLKLVHLVRILLFVHRCTELPAYGYDIDTFCYRTERTPTVSTCFESMDVR